MPVAEATAALEDMPSEDELQTAALDDDAPEQGDLLAASAPAAQPEAQPERLTLAEPAAEQPEAPLFPEHRGDDRRRSGGGFFSLFGGRKPYEPRPLDARTPAGPTGRTQGALPTRGNTAQQAAVQEEPELPESQEDLDIPSFLRRLAN